MFLQISNNCTHHSVSATKTVELLGLFSIVVHSCSLWTQRKSLGSESWVSSHLCGMSLRVLLLSLSYFGSLLKCHITTEACSTALSRHFLTPLPHISLHSTYHVSVILKIYLFLLIFSNRMRARTFLLVTAVSLMSQTVSRTQWSSSNIYKQMKYTNLI